MGARMDQGATGSVARQTAPPAEQAQAAPTAAREQPGLAAALRGQLKLRWKRPSNVLRRSRPSAWSWRAGLPRPAWGCRRCLRSAALTGLARDCAAEGGPAQVASGRPSSAWLARLGGAAAGGGACRAGQRRRRRPPRPWGYSARATRSGEWPCQPTTARQQSGPCSPAASGELPPQPLRYGPLGNRCEAPRPAVPGPCGCRARPRPGGTRWTLAPCRCTPGPRRRSSRPQQGSCSGRGRPRRTHTHRCGFSEATA